MPRLLTLPMRAAVLTAAIGSAAIGQPTPAGPATPPILELRLASDKPAPRFSVRQDQERADQPTVLYLAPDRLVSDTDIVLARTRPAPDGIVVRIQLTNAAAARLREASANNIGKYMAVFGHGVFSGAANIMSSVPRGNELTVGLTLPAALADSVRARVAERWPRRRR